MLGFWAVWMLGACGLWGEGQVDRVALDVVTPVAKMHSAEVRSLVDFIVPATIDSGPESRLWQRCRQGEDVRHLFRSRFAVVEVGPSAVRLSGTEVVKLYRFIARDTDLRGQVLIPLYEAAQRLVMNRKAAGAVGGCWPSFEGELLIAVHPDAPFSILREVMYTMGQAQFSEFSFMVSDAAAVRLAQGKPPPPRPVSDPSDRGRCWDSIVAELHTDHTLRLAATPYHGGTVRPEVHNLTVVLHSATGLPDVAGLEAWLNTITFPASSGRTRTVRWLTYVRGPVAYGAVMAVTDVARAALPEASWTTSASGGALSSLVHDWPHVRIAPMAARALVAVVPSSLPSIGRPRDCEGLDGQQYPHPDLMRK